MASTLAHRLILVANPGSSSRKYALFDENLHQRAGLHVEIEDGKIVATLQHVGELRKVSTKILSIDEAAKHVLDIFKKYHIITEDEKIGAIGLRVVAPSSFFLKHQLISDEVVDKLKKLREFAPLHIEAMLGELEILRKHFASTPIVAVSDSAFHISKPSFAWNYGIKLSDADNFDIKRFGYHGLSAEAVITNLQEGGKLTPKVIVCHIGSGSSVSAVFHGRSVDTTMGFSPLEGVVMATRSGTIDYGAVKALQYHLQLSNKQLEGYLHKASGLKGLGGSEDIRQLIARESKGSESARLALSTLVYSFHKSIGAMVAALNGVDSLVFTGTAGERSSYLRERIVKNLAYCDFWIDKAENERCRLPLRRRTISAKARSKPIFVVPTHEARQIAVHTITNCLPK